MMVESLVQEGADLGEPEADIENTTDIIGRGVGLELNMDIKISLQSSVTCWQLFYYALL